MAVESFLTPSDVKLTVEKEVKRKPSIEELTTVESPGRPTPTDQLEETKEKPKTARKRKVEKAEPQNIEYKKNSILIITEKPQAAEKIANSFGRASKHSDGGVSYFELEKDGKTIRVASAVGHLFGLDYKEGQKGWPIFEIEWRPAYEKKNSAFTKKYYMLLKRLSREAGEIIIATDYDIEGEVIGWNVLRFICHRQTAKRMKYSTLTKDELQKSYENLMPEPDWGMAYAGETRHILDWLYGINLSRALMSAIKMAGSFKILSIGRVQGPALKIIVDREHEIANFKSVPYWQVLAIIDNFEFKHPKDIFDKKDLEKFKDIKEGIAETKETEESILPPPPFDLTTLQREAYNLHKINPSQTLSAAQKLYLQGLISYPRTSSQKIPESIEPKKILKALEKNFPQAKEISRAKPIEGKKSDPAHPSIYPTGEFAELSDYDKKVYELIVKRFISVFTKDAQVLNKKVIVKAKDHPEIDFRASGLKILEKGWTKVYPSYLEESDVPTLQGPVKIDEIKFLEKETQPPKRYTPTSLITLLEKKNLGTKSTRSSIVDTLFDRGYLDGKSIEATPLGMKLIESLEKYSPIIIDENLTRVLEDEMEKIQESKKDLDKMEQKVIDKAKKIITDISKEFKIKEKQIGEEILKGIQVQREIQQQNNILTPCTKCNKGNLRLMYSPKIRRHFVACSNYPECRNTFSLPPNALIKKSDKFCEFCKFPKLLSIKKGRRPWEFCFNRDCEVNKARLEEWKQKQASQSANNQENRNQVAG